MSRLLPAALTLAAVALTWLVWVDGADLADLAGLGGLDPLPRLALVFILLAAMDRILDRALARHADKGRNGDADR